MLFTWLCNEVIYDNDNNNNNNNNNNNSDNNNNNTRRRLRIFLMLIALFHISANFISMFLRKVNYSQVFLTIFPNFLCVY